MTEPHIHRSVPRDEHVANVRLSLETRRLRLALMTDCHRYLTPFVEDPAALQLLQRLADAIVEDDC